VTIGTIMKRSILLNVGLAMLLALAGTVGCKRQPKAPTPIPSRGVGDTGAPDTFGVVRPGDADQARVIPPAPPVTPLDQDVGIDPSLRPSLDGGGPLPDLSFMRPNSEFFAAYTIYFDFDRSAIRPSERSKLEAVGQHLLANPRHAVRVEGHCDERGTEGYNLALGERRALSAREYLVNMGVPGSRVDTISYGESRPADPRSNEEAWARNRRGEFILLTE
jgi:peptidoglycan-associated lipoprotein